MTTVVEKKEKETDMNACGGCQAWILRYQSLLYLDLLTICRLCGRLSTPAEKERGVSETSLAARCSPTNVPYLAGR
jgi:hypothetical protein